MGELKKKLQHNDNKHFTQKQQYSYNERTIP